MFLYILGFLFILYLFGGSILDVLEWIFDKIEDLFFFLEDVKDGIVDTKDKISDKIEETKAKKEAAEERKRIEELMALHHDFTDPDTLPHDHVVLTEMYKAYIEEGDHPRTMLCMVLASKYGSKHADYDIAEYLLKNARNVDEQLRAVHHAKVAVLLGTKNARQLQKDVLKAFSYDIGNHYLNQDDYKKAEEYFELAVKHGIYKASTLLACLVAQRAETSEDWQQAENWAELAEEKNVAEPDILQLCRKNRLTTQGMEYQDQEKFDEAIDCFIEAAKLGSHDAAASAAMLLNLYGKSVEDHSIAAHMAQQAVDNDAMKGDTYVTITVASLEAMNAAEKPYRAGFAAQEEGNMNLAEQYWTEAASLGYSSAMYNLAILKSNNSEYEEAEKLALLAKHMERRDPHIKGLDQFIHNTTAKKLFIQGADVYNRFKDTNNRADFDECIRLWEESAEMDCMAAIMMLPRTLIENHKTVAELKKARHWTEVAIKNGETKLEATLNPIDKLIHIISAEEAKERKEYRKAANHYREINRISPDPDAALKALLLYMEHVASTPEDWDVADTLVAFCNMPDEAMNEIRNLIRIMRDASPDMLERYRKEMRKDS